MLEFKRRQPADVANPDAGSDVLFLDPSGVFYTKSSNGALTVLGRGIVSIAKVGTAGLVDTYRITLSGGDTQDYTVTNGDDGRSIVSITPPANPGVAGALDTYTINYSEAPLTSTFVVRNGTNGLDGSGQPAANPPSKIDPDDAAATGTRTAFYALEDHQHQIDAAAAVGLNGGSTNTEGAGSAFARNDHTHAIANGGTPSTITPDAAANQGASTSLARSDHTHAIAADVPVALGASASEGTSNSFARADHVHVNPVIAHEAAADPHPQYNTAAETTTQINSALAAATADAAPPAIAATGALGASTQFAREDHTHSGVTSVSVNGGPAQTGAVSVTTPAPKLSATISSLFASTANSTAVQVVVSLAIPAGYLTAGKTFDFDLEGTQSQSAAATNVVGAIFVNGTQLVSAAVAGGTAAQTNRSIRMKGGIMWNGANYIGNITTGISGVMPVGSANVTGVAVAAGTAHNIDIRVQTSTANAANIIRAVAAAIKEA